MAYRLVDDLRTIFLGFPADNVTDWPWFPCPTCKRGGLILKNDSLVKEESIISEREQYSSPFEYGKFHCILKCRISTTCEVVRILGEWNTEERFDECGQFITFFDRLNPKSFVPPLPLIESSDPWPQVVRERIDVAAKLLWTNPSSAANQLRSVVEGLMDDQGISSAKLHARIKEFQASKPEYAEAADLLMAVKCIGNAGSHGDTLGVLDVLDGVEILDIALELIYGDIRQKIKRCADEIIARKGEPERFEFEIEDLFS
jgi:hypothetical protein